MALLVLYKTINIHFLNKGPNLKYLITLCIKLNERVSVIKSNPGITSMLPRPLLSCYETEKKTTDTPKSTDKTC